MEWTRGEHSKLISFVAAGNDEERKCKKTRELAGHLEGNEARSFYEELISDKVVNDTFLKGKAVGTEQTLPNSIEKDLAFCENSNTRTASISCVSELDINRYLRYAQEGNIRQVILLLNKGVSVDSQDKYGWTALMCAAHSGQYDVVKYLLSFGAKYNILDDKRRTASDIAISAGFSKISQLLENFHKRKPQKILSDEQDTKNQIFCELCNGNFTDVSVKSHESSVIHLFNSKKKAKADPFLLPSTNRGYKMMLRSGWDGCKGLGSEGQGQRYPVKTVLKRDRKCLGSEKVDKPKITHFNANDKAAVKRNPERKLTKRVLNKRELKAKERKCKNWERNLRSIMS